MILGVQASSILFGVISVVVGILIFIFPRLLNYIIAAYLIIIGVTAILSGIF
jgi:uncharacterized membrane protein HdeD (DUF308 family)